MPYIIKKIDNSDKNIAFSTIEDGNMWRSNSNRIKAESNRNNFLQSIGVDKSKLLKIRPSHSPNIDLVRFFSKDFNKFERFLISPIIDTDFDFYYDGADGILTYDKECSVALISGDCTPLVVIHNKTGLFGILHIGMLGALNNMVENLSRVLHSEDIKIEEVSFFLGPSIQQEHYDVNKSGLWNAISSQAMKKVKNINDFIKSVDNSNFFDLHGMIKKQLLDIGAIPEKVYSYSKSTADIKTPFFSHYKMKNAEENGRFFTVIKKGY